MKLDKPFEVLEASQSSLSVLLPLVSPPYTKPQNQRNKELDGKMVNLLFIEMLERL
jgi:hypothetical protein